jgi:hypothetical protein
MAVERWTDPVGRLYIKVPLVNNLMNLRGWRLNPQANERKAPTAINKPVTVMLNKAESRFNDYHPFAMPKIDPVTGLVSEPTSGEHTIFAARYGFGIIREVSKSSSRYKAASGEIPWFATYEVLDPFAKEELSKPDSKLVPTQYSAGIVHLSGPDDDITDYEIVHLAAVPIGAYGPRFIKLATCNGNDVTCLPQLKGASYKERTGSCPVETFRSFSSLLPKGASSDSNNMSLQPAEPPAPTQPAGTNSADNSAVKGVETQGQQGQGQNPPKKITVKINRANKKVSNEPNPNDNNTNDENEEQGEGESGEQNEEQPNDNEANRIPSNKEKALMNRIAVLEKGRTEDKTRYAIEGILRNYPQRFSNPAGKFQEKKFNEAVNEYTKQVLNGQASIAMIQRLAELEATVPQIEVKRASSPFDDYIAPAIQPKGASASSLEAEEDNSEARKLAIQYRTYLGGGFY